MDVTAEKNNWIKKDNHKNTQISLLLSKYLVSFDRSPPIIFKSSCVDPQSFLSRQVDVLYPMISDEMQTGLNSGTKICLWLHSGHWSRKLNGGKFIAPLLVEYLIKLADKLRMMSAEASRGCRGWEGDLREGRGNGSKMVRGSFMLQYSQHTSSTFYSELELGQSRKSSQF